MSVKRSIPLYKEEIDEIQLHAFGDASGRGVCAAVYAVVTQVSGVSQGLVTAKCRLAKQGLTIPRLELVSGHMAVNLATNVRQALEGLPLSTTVHCWLDSSVALHWIGDRGEYRQFVANRVRKFRPTQTSCGIMFPQPTTQPIWEAVVVVLLERNCGGTGPHGLQAHPSGHQRL